MDATILINIPILKSEKNNNPRGKTTGYSEGKIILKSPCPPFPKGGPDRVTPYKATGNNKFNRTVAVL